MEKDEGNETVQGLKYVNDKSAEFIEEYNKKYSTNWRSFQPDFRIMVHRCLTPLKASWSEYDPEEKLMRIESNFWYVAVSCDKTVSDRSESQQWTIYVPTTRVKVAE